MTANFHLRQLSYGTVTPTNLTQFGFLHLFRNPVFVLTRN